MALVKGRHCSESCMELLNLEMVHHYQEQTRLPCAAAIEAIGFRVGRQLAERYTANRARTAEPLEVIKFICKEFWVAVFRKQVNNLRTNHRGTFVLKDQSFRWLAKLSVNPLPPSSIPQNGSLPVHPAAEPARDYLVLPCALIRGALVHLGVECSVTADASALPACDFTITIKNR